MDIWHPIRLLVVTFIYFLFVLCFSFLKMHPKHPETRCSEWFEQQEKAEVEWLNRGTQPPKKETQTEQNKSVCLQHTGFNLLKTLTAVICAVVA
jgi:hypothetical protein